MGETTRYSLRITFLSGNYTITSLFEPELDNFLNWYRNPEETEIMILSENKNGCLIHRPMFRWQISDMEYSLLTS